MTERSQTLQRSQALPSVIKKVILEGHLFALVDDDNERSFIYKTNKVDGHIIVWSRIVGKRFARLYKIDSGWLVPLTLIRKDKAKEQFGAELFTVFWNNLLREQGSKSITIWHHCRCRRCNRPLSDPKSITLQIGPSCLEKEQKGIPFRRRKRTRNI